MKFIALGVLLTMLGGWMLLTIDGKELGDLLGFAWVALIAGPAVVIFGVYAWPRDSDGE